LGIDHRTCDAGRFSRSTNVRGGSALVVFVLPEGAR
jgi:hypothetical protein